MLNRTVQVSVIAALVIVGGCATKKKDLPPPALAETGTPDTGGTGTTTPSGVADPVGVGTTSVPGSTADFVAQSGSDTVYFGYDSYELDELSRGTLGKQSEWLARYGQVKVTIEGHTDERGTREYNLALGDRRANAAKNFLAAQGVDVSRISTISYGKERPVAEGTDEAAMAKDRRAVTVLIGAVR